MSTHSGLSRRHLLGITMAVGGLAMMRGLRRVWAQAAGSGPVTLDVRHPDLHTLIAPETPLTRIAGGLGFTEGPVWRGTALLFSDIPNKRIVRWRRLPEGPELTTYATGMSNGLTLDRQGQVLAAEHNGRRVTRVAEDGTRTVLAERFQGKRLNSPNDLVVKSDGSLYFTDPPYGVQPPTPGVPRPAGWWSAPLPGKELAVNGVYRLTPDGTLSLLVDDFALPNGLAFAPAVATRCPRPVHMPAHGVAWHYHRTSPETWTRFPGFPGPVCMKVHGLSHILRAHRHRLVSGVANVERDGNNLL
jgi:hypothetical protein